MKVSGGKRVSAVREGKPRGLHILLLAAGQGRWQGARLTYREQLRCGTPWMQFLVVPRSIVSHDFGEPPVHMNIINVRV